MMSDVETPSVRFVSLNFPIAFTCFQDHCAKIRIGNGEIQEYEWYPIFKVKIVTNKFIDVVSSSTCICISTWDKHSYEYEWNRNAAENY